MRDVCPVLLTRAPWCAACARYGLGQTYEILRMFFYALDYYQKAACLRP